MSDILEYKGIAILTVFLVLFIIERLRPNALNVVKRPFKRLVKNLFFWPINIGLSFMVILPISFAATQMHFWERPEWAGGIAGLIINLLILDLFIFWWHRAVHEIPFLWKFHEVHHMDEHLDTTSAIRFHFGEIFFASFARAIVIILFAIPFTSIVIFEALVFVFSLFHHSNITLPKNTERMIAKIIVTPSLHWVHHHAIRRDTDSNYGTILSVWDRIFKTRSATQRFADMPIGVEGLKDKDFSKLVVRPFKNILSFNKYKTMLKYMLASKKNTHDGTEPYMKEGVLHLSPSQSYDVLLTRDDIVVLDVRTPKEFDEGHIKGALNYDYFSPDFKESLKTIDTQKTYLVHCAVGGRSTEALFVLKEIGVTDIMHMDDGLKKWSEDELPLES